MTTVVQMLNEPEALCGCADSLENWGDNELDAGISLESVNEQLVSLISAVTGWSNLLKGKKTMIKTLRPILVPPNCPCGKSGSNTTKYNNGKNSSHNLFHLDGCCTLLEYGKQKVAAERDIDINAKLLNNNTTTNNNKKSSSVRKTAAAWLKSSTSSSSSSASSSSNNHPSTATTMDLLQLLAINALEFTAPASAAFFLHQSNSPTAPPVTNNTTSSNNINNATTTNNTTTSPSTNHCNSNNSINNSTSSNSTTSSCESRDGQIPITHIRRSFVQLSGHPGCFAPAGPSSLWKKQADGSNETRVYEYLASSDDPMKLVIPTFHSRTEWNGETFLEIEDLLTGFDHCPAVMDLKIGCRTFLESEVTNSSARSDLYKKMVAQDPSAPTEEEHAIKAVTKLRYMQFREEQSSTSSLGFRIEAIKFSNTKEPVSDLKTMKTESQVYDTMSKFLPTDPALRAELLERLREIRRNLEASDFFMRHEVIGSSVLLIHDSVRVGAWLIDFAKTVQSPVGRLSHRTAWEMGNHEDGYLIGLDNLIKIVGSVS